MLQSSSGRKWKEVRNNIAIYSHALPRIHVIGGQKSVRIAPPSLPPHHCGPATRDFQSSMSVEALFHRCHLDVQGLLHQQLLSSAMVQHGGLLPVDRVVVLPRMFHYSWLLHHPPLAGISVFLQPHLQSLFGLSDVDLAELQGIWYTTLDCLPGGNVSFTLVNIERRVRTESPSGLKDYFDVKLPANRLMSSLIPVT